ncbi:cupin domain-containing protein [Longispora sp. K20-0274]|uniref:cupin domain-containing protein n=1 Tax=Longispora sp. K20-0274 TaxID=3088255 RepID=UPI00399AAFE0
MRQFSSGSAESSAIGVVDVARWEQYGLDGTMPFQAMWYTIPPGGSGPRDGHPELELSIVVSGVATVETGGQVTDVPVGAAFLLDSEEPHVIRNRSADVPLVVFSAYWMPLTTEEKAL